jgi:hypothetical protein
MRQERLRTICKASTDSQTITTSSICGQRASNRQEWALYATSTGGYQSLAELASVFHYLALSETIGSRLPLSPGCGSCRSTTERPALRLNRGAGMLPAPPLIVIVAFGKTPAKSAIIRRRRRSDRGSSPWSTPPRSLSRTFLSRPSFRTPPRGRAVGSANRRSGRPGYRST